VKKIRRQRIRDITRRRSESNARGACRIIGSNSTSRFCVIESHGNDSKTRKLGALWTETESRWKAIFHLRTADSKTTEKRFFASDCDWKEKWIFYDNPKKKKYYAKLGQSLPSTSTSTPRPNIHDSKIMLCIWWVQKGLVYSELLKPGDSITDDRYRLQLIRLSCALREKRLEYEQRHNKVILLHDNARPHVAKVVKIFGNAQMGCFIAPTVFSGHCSFWLLVVPKDAASHRFTSFAEIENWL